MDYMGRNKEKTKKMNKTKIEWADYTWNPITGCSRKCEYCYARKIARRFGKTKNEKEFIPTFHPERLNDIRKIKNPSKIFVCSMGEIFDPQVRLDWLIKIFKIIEDYSFHTFILLTKNADMLNNLCLSLPSNVWLGTTIEDSYGNPCNFISFLNKLALINSWGRAKDIQSWKNKSKFQGKIFISFEPLLGDVFSNFASYFYSLSWKWDWFIVGGQTNPNKQPKHEWVENIVAHAKQHVIPLFIKNNTGWKDIIQEFPTD